MITCTDYRTRILAEPGADSDDLREHRESCAICAAYTQRLQRFEGRLTLLPGNRGLSSVPVKLEHA